MKILRHTVMATMCDNTSVGILVRRDGGLLLIERAKPPYGFAPPAGHVDEFGSYEKAAQEELREETGLTAESIELVEEGRKENSCRRKDGSWHYWKIYRATVSGDLERSREETKQAGWHAPDDIRRLAERTQQYQAGDISQQEWEQSPGLEPVWYEWFTALKIL